LTIKDNQTNEEEWFSNTGVTDAFDRFLNLIGDRIQLLGYDGYAAGLDTKSKSDRRGITQSLVN
jgi:hypothetical protein